MSAVEPKIPIEVPPLQGVYAEPWSLGKLWRLMAFFGPAAVATSVSIGAGETLVVVVTGAWARYRLLWLVLLACLVKGVFVTYLLGRYTAITGEPLGHRLARLPGPRGWLLLFLIAVELTIAGPTYAVISRPCGNLLAYLSQDWLPGSRVGGHLSAEASRFWETALAMAFICLALGLSLKLSYRRLEKQNLVICGILVAGTVLATLLVQPDFKEAIRGTLVPQLPLTRWPEPIEARDYGLDYVLLMITVFGYVGNTVFGYLVYANWVGIHGWGLTGHPRIGEVRRRFAGNDFGYLPRDPVQVRRLRRQLAPLRWDVGMGAVVLFIVTAAFMMAGAQVLYPRAQVDAAHQMPQWQEVLTEQRHVWAGLHPLLVPVYYICVLAALWGSLNALPEVWTRVCHEFLESIWPRQRDYRRLQIVVVALIFFPATTVLALNIDLPLLAGFVATLTCNVAVGIACAVGVYLNATLPREYRPHRFVLFGGAISTVVLMIAATGGLIGLGQQSGLW